MQTPQNLPALIKEMQERARKRFTTRNPELFDLPNHSTNVVIDSRDSKEYLKDLDTAVTDTANATLEYVKGVVEEMASKTPWKVSGEPYINATDLIARLTSNPDLLKAIE